LTLPEQIVTFSKDSEITAKENSEMTARPHFNVTPRYTPGSPASVSQEIAKRVAAEERHSIQFDLSGVHGTEARARAEKLGLGPQPDARGVRRGIAEQVVEHSGHWMVSDLLTGEIYARPFAGGKSPLRCAKCAAAKERQSTALFGDAESTDLVAESVEVLIESADGTLTTGLVDLLVEVVEPALVEPAPSYTSDPLPSYSDPSPSYSDPSPSSMDS
jgi:hypothetical protein